MSRWRIWQVPWRRRLEGCSWLVAGTCVLLWSKFWDSGAEVALLAVASALLLTGIVVRLVTWWNRTGLAAQGVMLGPNCLFLGFCANRWAELAPLGSAAWYAMPFLGLGLTFGGIGWQILGAVRTVGSRPGGGASTGQEYS